MSVTSDNIKELIKDGTEFYVTVNPFLPFLYKPYEQEVEITVGDKNELYWKYKGAINFWRRVDFKKHCDHLFINNEVIYRIY